MSDEDTYDAKAREIVTRFIANPLCAVSGRDRLINDIAAALRSQAEQSTYQGALLMMRPHIAELRELAARKDAEIAALRKRLET